MPEPRALAACTLAVGAAALVGPPAPAIVIRHDVPDSEYLERASEPQFAAVGRLVAAGTLRGTGTLIGCGWVLTAGHVADEAAPEQWTFELDDVVHDVIDVVIHPEWTGDLDEGNDVALVRLAAPVTGVEPAGLLREGDAHGTPVTLLGYGGTGNGIDGIVSPDGRLRAGTNAIEDFIFDYMLFYFDAPGSGDETPLECMAAHSDSGGPVFVETKEGWRVAGSHSFILDWNGNGALGDYDDLTGSSRVSLHGDWIDLVVGTWCPLDLDDSGAVDVQDLLAVLAAWGPCGSCAEDVDESGTVDVADLLTVLAGWGPCV